MKMRGSETVKEDFKTQIFDIFGTVDLEQLRAIAQKVQLIESEKTHNERGAGRKNSLTPQQLAEMLALHQQGMGATELAKKYGISRQTIYKQLERAQNFSDDPNTMLRLNYMNRNDLCTTIDVGSNFFADPGGFCGPGFYQFLTGLPLTLRSGPPDGAAAR